MRAIAPLTFQSHAIFYSFRVAALLLMSGALAGMAGLMREAHGQAEGPSLRSTQRPVRVAVDPTYQYYETEEGRGLEELTSRLSAFVPFGQRFSVQASASYAQMDADTLQQVQGPTDVAVGLTYAQPMGEGSVVFQLHVRAAGHWYGETVGEEQKLFGRAYLSPSFQLAGGIAVEPHGTVTYGSYLGLGGGLRVEGRF